MFTSTGQLTPASQPPEVATSEAQMAALWVCDQCQAWWGSQNGPQREARFLLRLAEPYTHLFKWEDYRGWREKAAEAHVCPGCRHEVAQPRFTLLSQLT